MNLAVHGCDWLPTLYSTTGVEPPTNGKPLDGVNVMPILASGKSSPEDTRQTFDRIQNRHLYFQKNRYRPSVYSDAAIRSGPWKLVWPGVPVTMKKDIGRDNPSYLRGVVHAHWEMPMDQQLDPVPTHERPRPKLFHLEDDPAESRDRADEQPTVVAELTSAYASWCVDVETEWRHARANIARHDRHYWSTRQPPDARALFRDFWQWNKAPEGTDPANADPLEVFPGYWTNGN